MAAYARGMQIERGAPRSAVTLVGGFVAVLWLVEIVDAVLPASLDVYGIRPRSQGGLEGIAAAPLLHGGFGHLMGNTVPLLVLGFFLALSGLRTFVLVTGVVWLTSGVGTWLVGQPGTIHLGASGLVFGWLVHLGVRGFVTRDLGQIVLGVIMLVAYGGILVGVLPGVAGVSWEGHLFGALGGALAAVVVSERRRTREERWD